MIQEVDGRPIILPAPGDRFDLRAAGIPRLLVWDHTTRQRVVLPVTIP